MKLLLLRGREERKQYFFKVFQELTKVFFRMKPVIIVNYSAMNTRQGKIQPKTSLENSHLKVFTLHQTNCKHLLIDNDNKATDTG